MRSGEEREYVVASLERWWVRSVRLRESDSKGRSLQAFEAFIKNTSDSAFVEV